MKLIYILNNLPLTRKHLVTFTNDAPVPTTIQILY